MVDGWRLNPLNMSLRDGHETVDSSTLLQGCRGRRESSYEAACSVGKPVTECGRRGVGSPDLIREVPIAAEWVAALR